MNNEVLWFGYLAIDRNVVPAEVCTELGETFSSDADVLQYAQAILDHGLSDDFEAIQELLNDACLEAPNGPPPVNVFARQKPVLRLKTVVNEDDGHPEQHHFPTPAVHGAKPDIDRISSMPDSAIAPLMRELLVWARAEGASDLHLSADALPFMRVHRKLRKIGTKKLSAADSKRLNFALLSTQQREDFEASDDYDLALAMDANNRFRVNLMLHKEGIAGTYRLVPNEAISLEDLGFRNHQVIEKLLDHHNGLILITGPVGSGKTTTLASLVNLINTKRDDHIITVEDPIEIVQRSKGCNLSQRQIGLHTKSFATALKGALREDPDIIVIGELRDLETIEMAITAAETGHLVIGTLHTNDASTTLNRLLDVFPPSQQPQIRSMTSESLRGVVCQQLLPATDGGLVLVCEVLINTLAVANMIREGKTHLIKQALETGSHSGMSTMDQSVQQLFEEGKITQETAIANIMDRQLRKRIESGALKTREATAEEAASAAASKKKGWFR